SSGSTRCPRSRRSRPRRQSTRCSIPPPRVQRMEEQRTFSLSQIQTYLGCPLKYRFQYLDKLPKAFRPAALAFGGSIHSAVEWFHRQKMAGATPAIEDVFKVFEADWFAQNHDPLEFHSGETREALEAKARAMLTVYLEAQNGCPPVAV